MVHNLSGNIMIGLCEELRKIFLEEQKIKYLDSTVEEQRKELQKSKELFYDEIHPLFYSIWKEIWINHSQIQEGEGSANVHLWVVSLHGMELRHVALALNEYIKESTGKFPPNPLHFRELCRLVKNREQKIEELKKEENKLPILN